MKHVRLRFVLLATVCDLAIWIAAGFFATSEFYRRAIVMGGDVPPWEQVLEFQMVTALNWAIFTPLLVLIAQKLPLRPPHRLRNLMAIIVFIPYLAVFRAAWGGAVMNLGEGDPIKPDFVQLSVAIRTHRYSWIIAAIFFVYNLVEAQREAARRERHRANMQTLLAQAEMDELRARLQPRFAVGMLRHIAGVLRERPNAGEALIVTLGGILRRSMSRGNSDWVPLADELEHLDRCLELCSAGARRPMKARYVADDDALACHVPALALQPLIEDVALDLTSGDGGAIEVRCARDGDDVRVETGAATLRIPCQEALA